MRSGVEHAFLAVLSAAVIVVIAAAPAAAAELATYQLPDATHARSLSAASDGTIWFVPSRGSEWEGTSNSNIGSLSPEGVLAEHDVAGFGAIARLVVGPTDEVWVAGYRGGNPRERLLEVGRLSPSGVLTEAYGIGRKGWIGSMAIADDAIWVVHERTGRPDTIKSVSIDGGAVRQFALRPRCHAPAVAVGRNGALWFAEACSYGRRNESVGLGRGRIGRIAPGGQISRRPLLDPRDYPRSVAVGSDGTIWFGASHWDFSEPSVGRITSAGALAQYRIPGGFPRPIAVGPEGRIWFQSWFGGKAYLALNSIGVGGRLGKPICAEPGCQLEPSGLIGTNDGFWYGLNRPNLNSGGGGSGLAIGNEIANEAGLLGHLVP